MANCRKCGGYVEDGAKFCGHCGAKMNENSTPITTATPYTEDTKPTNSQRVIVFDGQIHKCPNCGATLGAFVKSCPDCGYELRGASSTNSVQEFSRRYSDATTNAQKVDIIRTFVIPNTKEDILEFVILASSNIDINAYSKSNVVVPGGTSRQDIIDAWMAKLEQAHQKANMILTDDPYLERINNVYSEKKKAIESAQTSSKVKRILGSIFGNKTLHFIILMFVLAIILPLTMCKIGCAVMKGMVDDSISTNQKNKESTSKPTSGEGSGPTQTLTEPSVSEESSVNGSSENTQESAEAQASSLTQTPTEPPASEKPSKNGFDEKTNKKYTLVHYSFSLPDYYVEREKGDTVLKFGTAKENAEAIIIMSCFPMTATEELYLDTVNVYSRSLYQMFGDPQVLSDDSITIAGLPGRKLLGTGSVDGIPASFCIVHLFDPNNQELVAFVFVQQDGSSTDYLSDIEKSIKSLQLS